MTPLTQTKKNYLADFSAKYFARTFDSQINVFRFVQTFGKQVKKKKPERDVESNRTKRKTGNETESL